MTLRRRWGLEIALAVVALAALFGMSFFALEARDSADALEDVERRLGTAQADGSITDLEALEREIEVLRAAPTVFPFPSRDQVEQRIGELEPLIRTSLVRLGAITLDETTATVTDQDVGAENGTNEPRAYPGMRLTLQAQGPASALLSMTAIVGDQLADGVIDDIVMTRLVDSTLFEISITTLLFHEPEAAG